ncbi:MAG: hypothetical protein ACP5G6_08770, partial [Conexivisphaera sp.]
MAVDLVPGVPPPYKPLEHVRMMSAEDLWDYDEGEGEEGEAVAGWTGHSSPDGTAPPDLDAVLGRRVGRVERTIL